MKISRLTVLLILLVGVLIVWFSWGKEDYRKVMKIAHSDGDYDVARSMGDIRYIPGDMHEMRTLNVYAPDDAENLPVVVFMHGGGWIGGSPNAVIRGLDPGTLGESGIILVTITHRPGYEVKSPGPEQDVAAAIAWVINNIADYGGDTERIFIAGHSSGAHIMSLAVLDPSLLAEHELDASSIAGVMHISGIVDLTVSLLVDGGIDSIKEYVGEDPERLREASPLYHVGKGPLPPFMIVYGANEGDWARQESEKFKDALIKHGGEASVYEMPDANHYNLTAFLNVRQKEFMDFLGVPQPESVSKPAKDEEPEPETEEEPEASHTAA